MSESAVSEKYVSTVRTAFLYSILLIPSLLLLDTRIVISVLIPTTMVAGTLCDNKLEATSTED